MTDATKMPLALRREMLIAECALQRIEAGREIMAMREPADGPGGVGQLLGGDLKIPLTIAGVVLGMIVTKPGRALPILTAGLSLWKFAGPLLKLLRRGPAPEPMPFE
jgi:hypothetical protein